MQGQTGRPTCSAFWTETSLAKMFASMLQSPPLRWYFLPGLTVPLQGGSGIIVQTRLQVPVADASAESAAVSFLQIKTQRIRLRLSDLIEEPTIGDLGAESVAPSASTIVVHLQSGDHTLQVPSFLELHSDITERTVLTELQHWGIPCQAFQFGGHPEFLCLPLDWCPPTECTHYMYCTPDGKSVEAAFLHSQRGELLTHFQHMQFLHKLGFIKAVILECVQLLPNLVRVLYINKVGIESNIPSMQQHSRRNVDLAASV